MFNFKSLSKQSAFSKLSKQLSKSKQWQLINIEPTRCILKNCITSKIYQTINLSAQQKQNQLLFGNTSMRQENSECSGQIFLQVIKIQENCHLVEKSCMSLSQKVFQHRFLQTKQFFSEEDILNTFMPIIKSLLKKQIPSFYSLKCENILIDSNQQIRLKNPLLLSNFYSSYDQCMEPCLSIYEQLVVSLLQIILLIPVDDILILIQQSNRSKMIIQLIHRQLSYKIISIILILINQQENILLIKLRQIVEDIQSFNQIKSVWLQQLINSIERVKQLQYFNISKQEENSQKTQTSNILTVSKTIKKNSSITSLRLDDETEDSQNQTLSKYRSGKRIINYQNINQSITPSDYVDCHLKTRKRRIKKQVNKQ